jgi:hypothetical protein
MPAQWQVGSTKQQLPAKNCKSWCLSCGKKHQSPRWYLARLEYDTSTGLWQLLLGDQLYQPDLQHSSEQQKKVDEFAARYSSFCNNPAVVGAMSAAVEQQ